MLRSGWCLTASSQYPCMKRKDYAFRRQLNEKPEITQGIEVVLARPIVPPIASSLQRTIPL